MSAVHIDPPRLTGYGVQLEPLGYHHGPGLVAAAAESREHYGYNPVPNGEEETAAYIEAALAAQLDGERMPFAIRWHGDIVGTTSYWELKPWRWPAGSSMQRLDRPDAVEVGSTWLSASAIGTACNTASKLLLLAHAFEVWHVHRVSFRTDVRNTRSRRAIEMLGATMEGIRRAHQPGEDGTVRDSALYSVVASEWADVRARIHDRVERRAQLYEREP